MTLVGRTALRSTLALLPVVACKDPSSGSADDSSTGNVASTGTGTDAATTSTSSSVDPSGIVSDPSLGETSPDGEGCCQIHAGSGCDEADVQACVCDQSPRCCAFGWDSGCVADALVCNATCMPDPDPGADEVTGNDAGNDTGSDSDTAKPGMGDCCESLPQPQCEDAAVTQCTCGIDPYCCNQFWDEYCVAIASSACRIDCGNDCCMPHDAVACNDADVFGCVVEQVESCFGDWSPQCVMVAQNQCGLACGG
jgi:hypothetical protein